MQDEALLRLITMLPAGKKSFHVWKFHSHFVLKRLKEIQRKLYMKTLVLTTTQPTWTFAGTTSMEMTLAKM